MIVMPMQVAWGDEPAAIKVEPQAEAVAEVSDTEPDEVSNTDETESPAKEETAEPETGEEQPVTE
jgi:hypothetical protein